MRPTRTCLLATLLIAGLASAALAQIAPQTGSNQMGTQTPSSTMDGDSPLALDASGQIGFGVRYGLGDGRGLAKKGYSQGLDFNQLISLNLEGGVPVTLPFVDIEGLLTVSAQLNSQQADNLQSLAMHFESERWVADFGDFLVGEDAPAFIVPDRKLKGFKVQGRLPDLTITGAFARVEGIAESKTFRGNTSNEVVTYTRVQPERPWLDTPYLRNLRGLAYFELTTEFVEGFTEIRLNLHADEGLRALFEGYELGFLFPQVRDEGPTLLEDGQFEILRTGGATFLILKRAALDLLRDRIRNAIDAYNRENELPPDERAEYPFNEGTDYELAFLEQLLGRATLDVDGERLALGDARRQRFYFLGHTEVDPDTLQLEVWQNEAWVDVTDPLLFDYRFDVFGEPGLVELDFPRDYFEDESSQLRASYDYTSTSGVYILGLSIVKESERVLLNGEPLARGVDYTIDYETGALILFREVGQDDVVRIEYEVLRGGLGGFTEYRRNLSQLSLAFRPLDWLEVDVDVFQGADTGGVEDRERLRTMPNTHTVAGLRARADLGAFRADLTLGGAANAYPFDDNGRQNLPNRVNAIHTLEHAGQTFVLFAHQNGLTVYDGSSWTLYDTGDGLSGRSVYDVAASADWAALATEAGVTLIRLEGDDPFARAGNWRRLYQQDGLAHNRTGALAFERDGLWVGTQQGITRVPLDALDEPERWASVRPEELDGLHDAPIQALAVAGGLLYLGSAQGLQIYDPLAETLSSDPALNGTAVHDLASDGRSVYAASDAGVRTLSGKRGVGWLATGRAVHALALRGIEVWYAPERGLRATGFARPSRELDDVPVRALATQGEVVWAGTAGHITQEETPFGTGPRYALSVWRVGPESARAFDAVTTRISGRDRNRFADVPLDEHLDLGWLSQLALSYTVGNFTVTSALEGVAPGYLPVGGTARQDHARWRLNGRYDVTPELSLSAEHSAGAVRGQYTVTDSVGINWSAGPQLELDYSEQRADTRARTPGFDRVDSSLSVRATEAFLNDRLEVSLGLDDEGSRNAGSDRLNQNVTLTALVDYQVTDLLGVQLDLRGPLRASTAGDRVSLYGSGEFDGRVRWTPQFGFGSMSVNYRRGTELRLPELRESSDDALELDLNWESFNWAGALVVPRSSASFEQRRSDRGDQTTRLALQNSVQTRFEDLSAQARWNRDLSFDAQSQRGQIQDTVGARFNYNGFDRLTPGLDWTLRLNHLRHPTLGQKLFWSQQLNASLGWEPLEALTVNANANGELVNNDQERTASLGLSASSSYRLIESLSLSFKLNGDWRAGLVREDRIETLDADATLDGSWTLNEDWTSTFSAGLLWGRDAVNRQNDYLSYVLSARASMTF